MEKDKMNKKLIALLSTVSILSINSMAYAGCTVASSLSDSDTNEYCPTGNFTATSLANLNVDTHSSADSPNQSAVYASAANPVIDNHGQVSAHGVSSPAYTIFLKNNGTVTNSGSITAINTGGGTAFGIITSVDGVTITNTDTGTISASGGTGSYAIDFTGGGKKQDQSNCTLNNCGVIKGDVRLG